MNDSSRTGFHDKFDGTTPLRHNWYRIQGGEVTVDCLSLDTALTFNSEAIDSKSHKIVGMNKQLNLNIGAEDLWLRSLSDSDTNLSGCSEVSPDVSILCVWLYPHKEPGIYPRDDANKHRSNLKEKNSNSSPQEGKLNRHRKLAFKQFAHIITVKVAFPLERGVAHCFIDAIYQSQKLPANV